MIPNNIGRLSFVFLKLNKRIVGYYNRSFYIRMTKRERGVNDMNCIYYSTADLERLFGIDETYSKGIAGKATQIISNFGEKESGAWRFNLREVTFIKHVKDFTGIFSKEMAFKSALELFYNVDCNRLDIRL